jgi:hypothetical protein
LVSLLALVQTGKVAEAISIVEAIPNPMEASVAFIELSRQAYRELHDISSMVALGNAGTQFALSKAASSEDSADADKLRRSAKILAFNTAANCWPGWGDISLDIKRGSSASGAEPGGALSRPDSGVESGP